MSAPSLAFIGHRTRRTSGTRDSRNAVSLWTSIKRLGESNIDTSTNKPSNPMLDPPQFQTSALSPETSPQPDRPIAKARSIRAFRILPSVARRSTRIQIQESPPAPHQNTGASSVQSYDASRANVGHVFNHADGMSSTVEMPQFKRQTYVDTVPMSPLTPQNQLSHHCQVPVMVSNVANIPPIPSAYQCADKFIHNRIPGPDTSHSPSVQNPRPSPTPPPPPPPSQVSYSPFPCPSDLPPAFSTMPTQPRAPPIQSQMCGPSQTPFMHHTHLNALHASPEAAQQHMYPSGWSPLYGQHYLYGNHTLPTSLNGSQPVHLVNQFPSLHTTSQLPQPISQQPLPVHHNGVVSNHTASLHDKTSSTPTSHALEMRNAHVLQNEPWLGFPSSGAVIYSGGGTPFTLHKQTHGDAEKALHFPLNDKQPQSSPLHAEYTSGISENKLSGGEDNNGSRLTVLAKKGAYTQQHAPVSLVPTSEGPVNQFSELEVRNRNSEVFPFAVPRTSAQTLSTTNRDYASQNLKCVPQKDFVALFQPAEPTSSTQPVVVKVPQTSVSSIQVNKSGRKEMKLLRGCAINVIPHPSVSQNLTKRTNNNPSIEFHSNSVTDSFESELSEKDIAPGALPSDLDYAVLQHIFPSSQLMHALHALSMCTELGERYGEQQSKQKNTEPTVHEDSASSTELAPLKMLPHSQTAPAPSLKTSMQANILRKEFRLPGQRTNFSKFRNNQKHS